MQQVMTPVPPTAKITKWFHDETINKARSHTELQHSSSKTDHEDETSRSDWKIDTNPRLDIEYGFRLLFSRVDL